MRNERWFYRFYFVVFFFLFCFANSPFSLERIHTKSNNEILYVTNYHNVLAIQIELISEWLSYCTDTVDSIFDFCVSPLHTNIHAHDYGQNGFWFSFIQVRMYSCTRKKTTMTTFSREKKKIKSTATTTTNGNSISIWRFFAMASFVQTTMCLYFFFASSLSLSSPPLSRSFSRCRLSFFPNITDVIVACVADKNVKLLLSPLSIDFLFLLLLFFSLLFYRRKFRVRLWAYV